MTEKSYFDQMDQVRSLWKQRERGADGELVLSGVSKIDILVLVQTGSVSDVTSSGRDPSSKVIAQDSSDCQ